MTWPVEKGQMGKGGPGRLWTDREFLPRRREEEEEGGGEPQGWGRGNS